MSMDAKKKLVRDEDADENLRRDYFDSTEDDESRRRFQKPMPSQVVPYLRQSK